MKVEIYSDVACPWCYIGERRFARALAAFPGSDDVEVVFRPFQLDAGAPASATPLAHYLQRRFGRPVGDMLASVTAAAAAENISMDWDRALAVNTRTAHRLLRLAEREYGAGVQQDLMELLFDAHFSRGGNVADHALLTDLARSVGMDPARVGAYLASDEGDVEIETEFASARERGIRAVPTFVFDGRYAVSGAQPASTFLQALAEVQRHAADGEPAGEGDGDCAEGTCAATGASA